jgi:hypothetical protein
MHEGVLQFLRGWRDVGIQPANVAVGPAVENVHPPAGRVSEHKNRGASEVKLQHSLGDRHFLEAAAALGDHDGVENPVVRLLEVVPDERGIDSLVLAFCGGGASTVPALIVPLPVLALAETPRWRAWYSKKSALASLRADEGRRARG